MAYDGGKPATDGSLVSADIRENFRALKEDDIVEGVVALGIVAGMVGAGAITETKLGAAAVAQAKLKTSMGSVNVTGTQANITLPGGEYGFYPQTKTNSTSTTREVLASIAGGDGTTGSTSYITNIFLGNEDASFIGYAQQRYVTSSGEVFWVFILRDKSTKAIKAMYQAPDHPCFGNGGDPVIVPHPFRSYDKSTYEIIVINPSKEEVEAMYKICDAVVSKDLLEVIIEEYEVDEEAKADWSTIPVTVGLPRNYEIGKSVKTIKKVIPKPEYIKIKKLKKKVA